MDNFRKYQVQADSVADFLNRYYRPDRMTPTLIEVYQKEVDRNGYTFISHHDSITGRIVSFYLT
jgi:hypothetical protein